MSVATAHISLAHRLRIWCYVNLVMSLKNILAIMSRTEHLQIKKMEHIVIVEELIDSNRKAFVKAIRDIILKFSVKFQRMKENIF